MNKFVGLCANTGKRPGTLSDPGYRIRLTGPRTSAQPARKANPDAVAASKVPSRAIAAGRKGGKNANAGQDKKYQELDPKHLEHYVVVRRRDELGRTRRCVDTADNRGRLSRHAGLPSITFGRRAVRGHGSFGQARLDEKLSSATTPQDALEPRGFCPFAPDDDDEVAPCSLSVPAAFLTGKMDGTGIRITDHGARKEILELAHHCHDSMRGRHEAGLVGKIKAAIDMLLGTGGEFLERAALLERGVRPHVVRDIGNTRNRLIKKHEEQARIGNFS